jgi:hypothetical protein
MTVQKESMTSSKTLGRPVRGALWDADSRDNETSALEISHHLTLHVIGQDHYVLGGNRDQFANAIGVGSLFSPHVRKE